MASVTLASLSNAVELQEFPAPLGPAQLAQAPPPGDRLLCACARAGADAGLPYCANVGLRSVARSYP